MPGRVSGSASEAVAGSDVHVSFTRSGGFAGTTISGDLDSRKLPPEEARMLRDLVDAADFFAQPAVLEPTPRGADRFQWEVTVEAGPDRHTVRFTEGAEPAPMGELVRYLARSLRRGATTGGSTSSE
jgi:hypothetical protein